MEVVVTVRAIKLQSNRHHQQINTELFYRPDVPAVAQPTGSEQWRGCVDLHHSAYKISQAIIRALMQISTRITGSMYRSSVKIIRGTMYPLASLHYTPEQRVSYHTIYNLKHGSNWISDDATVWWWHNQTLCSPSSAAAAVRHHHCRVTPQHPNVFSPLYAT